MALVLYDLLGMQNVRYGQFAWRTRMALAHKQLEFETAPVAVRDKSAIAFSGQDRVPILIADSDVVCDSWQIAEHLEERFPAKPSLFGGAEGRGLSRFVNFYMDRVLIPALVPLLMIDVIGCVDADDGQHLRGQIEPVFKASLEDLAAQRERDILSYRKLLDPLRATLRAQPFLCGPQAGYADYILLSQLQWARLVSAFPVLAETDTLNDWRERMLDLHGGLARREPSRVDRDGAA